MRRALYTTGLIFDLDGVLTATEEYHYRSWRKLAHELDLAFGREAANRLRGRSREDALELFLTEGGYFGAAGRDDSGRASPGRAARPEGLTRRELLARKNEFFLEEIEDLGPHDLLPGAKRLLAAAKTAGVGLGLASSSRNARLVCARLGVGELFDGFADGCSGLRPKPEPDLFVWVAGSLGLPPGRCTVVEDSEAGVTAALAGGFRSVAVGGVAGASRPDMNLTDLSSVTLEELLGVPLDEPDSLDGGSRVPGADNGRDSGRGPSEVDE